jgi:ferric-chelate reductase
MILLLHVQMLKWEKIGVSNLAGEIALVAGLAMWLTTIPRIRRKVFELFFYTHYLYIIFMIFFILHVGISYCCMMLPGFYLFVIDRFLRFLQSRRNVRLLSARVLPCETLELNLSKSLGNNSLRTFYLLVFSKLMTALYYTMHV